MQITLIMAMSIDGRITKHSSSDVGSWTSIEDKKHFGSVIDGASLIIMGATTYEAYREKFVHEKGTLRIVMTRHPEKYSGEAQSGILEFTDLTPVDLVDSLTARGYTKALLTGGSVINGLFLKEKLVDELILTIEPKIFGGGTPLVQDISDSLDVRLRLLTCEKANDDGTLMLRYKIL